MEWTRVRAPLAMVALLACLARPATAQNLLTNGGFETPVVPEGDPLITVNAGSSFGGWQVAGGNIEIIPNDYQPAEGNQWIDMNGVLVGSIYQDVATTPGGLYDLFFALAGNPNRPNPKTLNVLWGPSGGALGVVGSFSFDQTGTNAFFMGWLEKSITGLVATSSSMRLYFQSTTPTTDAGNALDDVRLYAQSTVPEPASFLLLGTGLTAAAAARRRRRPAA